MSTGRGTTRPFETVGAPWADWRLADALNRRTPRLPAVRFREAYFTPTFDRYAGSLVSGVEIVVNDSLPLSTSRGGEAGRESEFDPVRTGIALLSACRQLYGGALGWRSPPQQKDRES